MLRKKTLLTILIVGSSLLSPLFTTQNCQATTGNEIIWPTSNHDVWLTSVGGTNYACVDELESDAGTTNVNDYAPVEEIDLYNMSDPSHSGYTIEGVRVYARCNKEIIFAPGQGAVFLKIKVGGTVYSSLPRSLTEGAFIIEYNTWPTNPDTSAAWTWAEVDDLIAGIGLETFWLAIGYCTQVWVSVRYTIPSGEDLKPTSDDDVWLLATDTTHYTEVDETDPPVTTDYIYQWEDSNPDTDTFGMDDSGVSLGAINSVTLVGYNDGGVLGFGTWGYGRFVVNMGGTEYYGGEQRIQVLGYYSETWTTNPDTASAWTWGNIDDLKAGIALRTTQSAGFYWTACMQFYVIVDYDTGRRIISIH